MPSPSTAASSPTRFVAHSVNPYLPMSQSWVYNQLRFLERYTPLVLAKRTENLEYFPLDHVYCHDRLPLWQRPFEKIAAKLTGRYPFYSRRVRQFDARIFHSHSGLFGAFDMPLARRLGVKHVVSLYGADIWKAYPVPKWTPMYDAMFEHSDLILAEGPAMRDKVVSLGCPAEKVKVHHIGIDLSRVAFEPRRPDDDGTVHVLMAGRAIPKKGHEVGVRAFAAIADACPQARMHIMTWGDAQRLAALQRLIDELGVGDRVAILGQRPYDQYLAFTRRCQVFFNPSLHAEDGDAEGGFPVTITEMMAAGMAIVASDHCDAPHIVRHGETGLVAPQGDAVALGAALREMIEHPERWAGFAQHGRALVEAQWDCRGQARALEGFYDGLWPS